MSNLVNTVFLELTTQEERERIEFSVGNICETNSDAVMMKQVWVNLISNAVKFSSKREKAVISISSKPENNTCVYCIRDNGAGFDQQFSDKVFGVFQRLHHESDFKGTGVGLAICERIIKRHKGEIWAHGEIGKGAAIYFSLPLQNNIQKA